MARCQRNIQGVITTFLHGLEHRTWTLGNVSKLEGGIDNFSFMQLLVQVGRVFLTMIGLFFVLDQLDKDLADVMEFLIRIPAESWCIFSVITDLQPLACDHRPWMSLPCHRLICDRNSRFSDCHRGRPCQVLPVTLSVASLCCHAGGWYSAGAATGIRVCGGSSSSSCFRGSRANGA